MLQQIRDMFKRPQDTKIHHTHTSIERVPKGEEKPASAVLGGLSKPSNVETFRK